MKDFIGHGITLEYSCEDDGIHILCSCGFEKNVGHSPHIEDCVAAATEHLSQVARKDDGK